MTIRHIHTGFFFIMFLGIVVSGLAESSVNPPPNKAAEVEWNEDKGAILLKYNGRTILNANVEAKNPDGSKADAKVALEQANKGNSVDKVEQQLCFRINGLKDGMMIILSGIISGSGEAFPAETEGKAQKLFPMVRNSVGLSRNLRNNTIYDRHWDWALIGADGQTTRITTKVDKESERQFDVQCMGTSIKLDFRPRYYQKTFGLEYYEPWTYKVWQGSVTGYCTWWAYKKQFTQKTLDDMVDLFVEKRLPDFGYQYMQLDDTYQIGNGSCPQNWLTWNGNFPGGAEYTLKRIKDAGMKGGIWVHRVHRPTDPHVTDIAKEHPDWFVKKADGSISTANGFYKLNTKNPEAIDGMVRPTYRELKKQGWDYVKIDGAGDLLGAYNNKECADHFKKINSTPEESLRDWDRVAREELGSDIYILNCWGTGPGRMVIGLVDGCRLSDDGFQPETLANNSAFEGVVWRGDADHCDILGGWLMDENAMMPVFGSDKPAPVRTIVRPAICSISGSVLMLSDKLDAYKDDANIEGMKRSAPVLTTVPGQLYNPGQKSATWWLQEIERPFDHWTVLTRMQWAKKREKEWKFDLKGLPEQEVKFSDLGLESDREYAIFEFWTQKFLGTFKGSFTAPAMDINDGMDVFAIREVRKHPWVLSTTRHLSQGGVSLSEVNWDEKKKTLSGKSAVVVDDPYVITMHVPEGYKVEKALMDEDEIRIKSEGATVAVQMIPAASGVIDWLVKFK